MRHVKRYRSLRGCGAAGQSRLVEFWKGSCSAECTITTTGTHNWWHSVLYVYYISTSRSLPSFDLNEELTFPEILDLYTGDCRIASGTFSVLQTLLVVKPYRMYLQSAPVLYKRAGSLVVNRIPANWAERLLRGFGLECATKVRVDPSPSFHSVKGIEYTERHLCMCL